MAVLPSPVTAARTSIEFYVVKGCDRYVDGQADAFPQIPPSNLRSSLRLPPTFCKLSACGLCGIFGAETEHRFSNVR